MFNKQVRIHQLNKENSGELADANRLTTLALLLALLLALIKRPVHIQLFEPFEVKLCKFLTIG